MRASFWLRAYPRRWREQRADELMAVLADASDHEPGRIDARTAFDLLRGGCATRWRLRPPLHVVLRYRVSGRRPHERFDGWLRDDIDGRLYPVREAAWFPVLLAPFVALVATWWPWLWTNFVIVAPVVFAAQVLTSARGRSRERARLFPPPPTNDAGPWGPYRGLEAS